MTAPRPPSALAFQVMLAKGNRSKAVTKACKQHGGFYLGSIGGPAAILAQNCIKKMEARLARSPPSPAPRYLAYLPCDRLF